MKRKVIASTNRLTASEKLSCQLFDMLIDLDMEIDGVKAEDILVSMQLLYPDAHVLDLQELIEEGHSMKESLDMLEAAVEEEHRKYGF